MGTNPGRDDSAPTSMMSAPSATICRAWASAFSGVFHCPPSEKESGVTFSIPMICVRRPRLSVLPSAHRYSRTAPAIYFSSINNCHACCGNPPSPRSFPRLSAVTVRVPKDNSPRIIIQSCCAEITTITPSAPKSSSMAEAICFVSRSCSCG